MIFEDFVGNSRGVMGETSFLVFIGFGVVRFNDLSFSYIWLDWKAAVSYILLFFLGGFYFCFTVCS